MKAAQFPLILIIGAMLGGCAAPQTPREFRTAVTGTGMSSMGHAHKSFEVARPARAVGETLQAQAGKCIGVQVDRTVTVNRREGGGQSQSQFIYRPKVMRDGDKIEMHVQVQVQGNATSLQREPEGGHYVLVADVSPIDRSRSKVDVYYSVYRAKSIAEAMNGWAAGTNLDCPDIAGTLR